MWMPNGSACGIPTSSQTAYVNSVRTMYDFKDTAEKRAALSRKNLATWNEASLKGSLDTYEKRLKSIDEKFNWEWKGHAAVRPARWVGPASGDYWSPRWYHGVYYTVCNDFLRARAARIAAGNVARKAL